MHFIDAEKMGNDAMRIGQGTGLLRGGATEGQEAAQDGDPVPEGTIAVDPILGPLVAEEA